MANQKQKIIFPKDKHMINSFEKQDLVLGAEEELRLEVSDKEIIKIHLLEGVAEIEGNPLPLNPIYITGRKLAIFCWKASKIELYGKPDICYIGKDTPMIQYLMSHYLIQEKRMKSLISNKVGPRVIILGSKNSGKRTLTHTFLNNSIKQGFKPIYVDISLNNEISIPGCIAATVVDNVVPNDYLIENAIIYFNGYSSPTGGTSNRFNEDLYLTQIKELGDSVLEKLNYDLNIYLQQYNMNENEILNQKDKSFLSSHEPQLFAAGSIVYCETFEGFDISLYKKAIEYFNCDMIFVLDNDRLYSALSIDSDLGRSLEDGSVKLCKLQKSSGVLSLDSKYRSEVDHKRLVNYFKGPMNNISLKGFEFSIKDVKILQIVNSQVDRNMLPIGKKIDLNLIIKEIVLQDEGVNIFNHSLQGRVVSLNYLDPKLLEELNKTSNYTNYVDEFCKAPVEYFGYIAKIDNSKIRIQTPAPEIKHLYFLIGEIKYN